MRMTGGPRKDSHATKSENLSRQMDVRIDEAGGFLAVKNALRNTNLFVVQKLHQKLQLTPLIPSLRQQATTGTYFIVPA